MLRIRTIKPEIASHEGLYDLEIETGLPIRFAWCMLFTVADREGRFLWRPRTLKSHILPHDEIDFSRVLDAWVTRGFIVKYRVLHACPTREARVTDEWIGWIPTFKKHQVINHRESASDLPSIDQADEVIDNRNKDLPTREARVTHASGTREGHARGEGKGREGKGKEGNVRSVRAREGLDEKTADERPKTNGCVDTEADRYARWQRFQKIYPAGVYAKSDFAIAEKFGEQRLADGDAVFEDFIAGAERLRAQQDALGNIGTRWVPSPKNFFDRITKRWQEPFPLPADPQTGSDAAGCGWTPPADDPKYNPELAAKIREEAAQKQAQAREDLINKLKMPLPKNGREAQS